MGKIPTSVKKKKKRSGLVRHWFQAAFFALTNGYAVGYMQGKIYMGASKQLCVPGLNCYSCPGATFACPIGSLQAVLTSSKFDFSCYVFGLIMAFGALLGRFVCGWLCPFGLVQDLLHKFPFPKKYKNMPGHKYLTKLKYVVLVLLVVVLPLAISNKVGVGTPWFCKLLCPSGTLLASLPLLAMNQSLRGAAGLLFDWKLAVLLLILLLAVLFYRPFCKYLCPLGALYGFFNPISLYRLNVDASKCVNCGGCAKACGMGVDIRETPNSFECIRCGDCLRACPTQAISSTASQLRGKGGTPSAMPAAPEGGQVQAVGGGETGFGKKRTLAGLLVLAAAVVLIVVGLMLKENAVVLQKAVRICLECIGIG